VPAQSNLSIIFKDFTFFSGTIGAEAVYLCYGNADGGLKLMVWGWCFGVTFLLAPSCKDILACFTQRSTPGPPLGAH